MHQAHLPLAQRLRFELRECDSGAVQVLAFEPGAAKPALFVDLKGTWPSQVVHVFNVLVVQGIGGSSSPVYVLHFHGGKIQPLLAADTRGQARVTVDEESRHVDVEVPADQRLDSPGETKRFRVPIEMFVNDPDVP